MARQKITPSVLLLILTTHSYAQNQWADKFDLLKTGVGEVQTDLGSGTGFIVEKSGFLLTNYHVVKGAKILHCRMAPGKRYEAKLVSFDEDNDVALLRVDPVVCQGRYVFSISPSASLRVGDTIATIGNPINFMQVLTSGRVASTLPDYFTSDIAISPGNSGGPVFDVSGTVVGIATFRAYVPGGSGLSGIIRSETLRQTLDRIPVARDGEGTFGLRTYTPPVAPPSGEAVPDLPEKTLRASVVSKMAVEKIPSMLIKNPRDFHTNVYTPITFAAEALAEGRYIADRRRKRGDATAESEEQISNYDVNVLTPVVYIAVVPELRETADSKGGRFLSALFGGYTTAAFEYTRDFVSMRLLVEGTLIQPLRATRFYVGSLVSENPLIDTRDVAYAGAYIYPVSAFDTSHKLTLQVKRSTDTDDGPTFEVPKELQKYVFDSMSKAIAESDR